MQKSPQVSPNAQTAQTKTFTFPNVKEALTEKAPSSSAATAAASTAGGGPGGGGVVATATSNTLGTATGVNNRNNMLLGYAETVSDHKSVLEKQGGNAAEGFISKLRPFGGNPPKNLI